MGLKRGHRIPAHPARLGDFVLRLITLKYLKTPHGVLVVLE
jgi:hypothetical protein